jgi:penicillin-insensitive murein endopeptidase
VTRGARRRVAVAAALGLVAALVVRHGNAVAIAFESDAPSRSHGTPSRGALENGKRLPSSGANFEVYSRLGALLGRNSVHADVRGIVLDAYAAVAESHPDLRFVYGESGWPQGGRFRPHRTHQNGLSVDFMVPVRDEKGRSVPLPTRAWTRFGYDLEFDAAGRHEELAIDFEAMAVHLAALDVAARAHGTRIERLILAPELQPLLWSTGAGRSLQDRFPVMTRKAWVRHDEHYHVDFAKPGR